MALFSKIDLLIAVIAEFPQCNFTIAEEYIMSKWNYGQNYSRFVSCTKKCDYFER